MDTAAPGTGIGDAARAVPSGRHRIEQTRIWTERHVGLTGLGFAVLAGAVTAAVTGRMVDNPGLSFTGLALLVAVIGVWLASLRPLRLTATREALPRRVVVGRTLTHTVEISAPRATGSFLLTEQFDPMLWPDVTWAVTSAGPTAAPFVTQFAAAFRGVYTIGPLEAIVGDPFGLCRRRHRVLDAVELVVHPRVELVVDRITAREWEDPVIRPPRSLPWPTGSEFYGIRDYAPGDDPRRIVWSAVARTGELVVREAEHGITDRIAVVIDTCLDNYRTGRFSPAFEAAVTAAASVAISHLHAGFSVSVDGCHDQVVTRTRGEHRRLEILDALTRLQREVDDLPTALRRLMRERNGAGHSVILTPVLTAPVASMLQVLGSRGRSVMLVLIITPETDPATLRHAGNLRCPVVEVAPSEPLRQPFWNAVGGNRR